MRAVRLGKHRAGLIEWRRAGMFQAGHADMRFPVDSPRVITRGEGVDYSSSVFQGRTEA